MASHKKNKHRKNKSIRNKIKKQFSINESIQAIHHEISQLIALKNRTQLLPSVQKTKNLLNRINKSLGNAKSQLRELTSTSFEELPLPIISLLPCPTLTDSQKAKMIDATWKLNEAGRIQLSYSFNPQYQSKNAKRLFHGVMQKLSYSDEIIFRRALKDWSKFSNDLIRFNKYKLNQFHSPDLVIGYCPEILIPQQEEYIIQGKSHKEYSHDGFIKKANICLNEKMEMSVDSSRLIQYKVFEQQLSKLSTSSHELGHILGIKLHPHDIPSLHETMLKFNYSAWCSIMSYKYLYGKSTSIITLFDSGIGYRPILTQPSVIEKQLLPALLSNSSISINLTHNHYQTIYYTAQNLFIALFYLPLMQSISEKTTERLIQHTTKSNVVTRNNKLCSGLSGVCGYIVAGVMVEIPLNQLYFFSLIYLMNESIELLKYHSRSPNQHISLICSVIQDYILAALKYSFFFVDTGYLYGQELGLSIELANNEKIIHYLFLFFLGSMTNSLFKQKQLTNVNDGIGSQIVSFMLDSMISISHKVTSPVYNKIKSTCSFTINTISSFFPCARGRKQDESVKTELTPTQNRNSAKIKSK